VLAPWRGPSSEFQVGQSFLFSLRLITIKLSGKRKLKFFWVAIHVYWWDRGGTGVTAYDVDFPGQKVTVTGAIIPEDVYRHVSRTGKITVLVPPPPPPPPSPEEPAKVEEPPKEEPPKAEEPKAEEAKPEEPKKEEAAPAPAPEEKKEEPPKEEAKPEEPKKEVMWKSLTNPD
jgi:hypothetical protein